MERKIILFCFVRSTKVLIDYLVKHPEIPKPTFLIEKGRKQSVGAGLNKVNYTPLYKIANKSRIS